MKQYTTPLFRSPVIVGLLAFAVAFPLLSACAPRRQAVVSTRTVTAIDEQPVVQPPRMIDISIVDLHGEPSDHPYDEKVVGTIVNDGDRPVSSISVRINAIDEDGNVVRSIETPPVSHTIAPFGGRATFDAFMPRDPEVAGYHAVAIAR